MSGRGIPGEQRRVLRRGGGGRRVGGPQPQLHLRRCKHQDRQVLHQIQTTVQEGELVLTYHS